MVVGLIVLIVVIVIGILLVLGIGIGTYNSIVSLRNKVDNSWHQIDVQLRKRYDLIPNLVETVKGYAAHEKETLEKIKALSKIKKFTDNKRFFLIDICFHLFFVRL